MRHAGRHSSFDVTSQHPEALNLWYQKGSPVGTDLNQI